MCSVSQAGPKSRGWTAANAIRSSSWKMRIRMRAQTAKGRDLKNIHSRGRETSHARHNKCSILFWASQPPPVCIFSSLGWVLRVLAKGSSWQRGEGADKKWTVGRCCSIGVVRWKITLTKTPAYACTRDNRYSSEMELRKSLPHLSAIYMHPLRASIYTFLMLAEIPTLPCKRTTTTTTPLSPTLNVVT